MATWCKQHECWHSAAMGCGYCMGRITQPKPKDADRSTAPLARIVSKKLTSGTTIPPATPEVSDAE